MPTPMAQPFVGCVQIESIGNTQVTSGVRGSHSLCLNCGHGWLSACYPACPAQDGQGASETARRDWSVKLHLELPPPSPGRFLLEAAIQMRQSTHVPDVLVPVRREPGEPRDQRDRGQRDRDQRGQRQTRQLREKGCNVLSTRATNYLIATRIGTRSNH